MLTKLNAIGPKIIISCPLPSIPKQESNSPATQPWSLLNTPWSFSLSCLFCLLMLEYPSSPYVFEKFVLQRSSSCHSHLEVATDLTLDNLHSEVPPFLWFSMWSSPYFLVAPLWPGSSPRITRICATDARVSWSVCIQCPVHAVVSKTLLSWMNIIVSLLLKFTHHILSIVKLEGWVLEKRMATHSSILAWEIPWTEEPGRLQ